MCTLAVLFSARVSHALTPPPGTRVVNDVEVRYTDANGTDYAPTSASVFTEVSSVPELTVLKTASPEPVFLGNHIYYTVQLANTGTAPLTGVTVQDAIPAKTVFVNATDGGNHASGQVIWSIPNLAVDETKLLGLTVRIPADQADVGEVIQNIAIVTANEIPLATGSAITTVAERTPGIVRFYNADWEETGLYSVDDTEIYLEVTDLDQNQDPTAVETVRVILENVDLGDSEEIVLTETDMDTGVFRAEIPTGDGDEQIAFAVDTRLRATYTDPLDANPVSQDGALIDPYGIVFDAITGVPVPGVQVSLRLKDGNLAGTHPDWPVGQPDVVTTDDSGEYSFPLVPAAPGGADYYLDIVPGLASSYTYPSRVPDSLLPMITTTGVAPIMGPGSKQVREVFTLSQGDPPVNSDIPLDPPPGAHLKVTKNANRTDAAIGDIVSYKVVVTNISPVTLSGISVTDITPRGMHYMKGSTRLDGADAANPIVRNGKALVWAVATLAADASVEIAYKTTVGVDARPGKVKNYVSAGSAGILLSNTAYHELEISAGVFTSKGTIIGKIFHDLNEDRLQADGETGIAGVTLYLEDGTWVVTDQHGKFSVHSVNPGTHVLRVDETTLPENLTLVPLSNRFMGAAASQIVDMYPGELLKANFAVRGVSDATKQRDHEAAKPSPTQSPDQDSAPETAAITRPPETPLEEQIETMIPALAFLQPTDGMVLTRDQVNIVVKAPQEAELVLRVNGRAIESDRLGRKIVHNTRRIAVYEFVSVKLENDAANQLHLQMKDPFGNVRGTSKITVHTVGGPDRIAIRMDSNEVPADGRSLLQVQAEVLDKHGRRIPGRGTVTAATSAGEIVEEDADPARGGHQVPCRNGVVAFSVQAPRQTGEATLSVSYDDVEQAEQVFFAPHLRGMMVVGTGEVTIGHGNTSGDFSSLQNSDDDWFEDGGYAGGRGAFFVKGEIAKDTLLTAAYDTHKEKRQDYFQENQTNSDNEERYPIYGDESELGYDAQSRDKLYVRIDRNRSYAMYGDIHTDLTENRLSAHQRTLTGMKTEIDAGPFTLKAFAADNDQTQVVDAIPGRGISGLYYLTRTDVVEGSEKIFIETRDRKRSDHVLDREPKARNTDYEIDYEYGTILFKEPIPTRDADLNPVFIVVNYESETEDENFFTYGGRGAVELNDNIELGLTAIVSENALDDSSIFGVDATVALPLNSVLKAEAAESDSLFDIDSISAPRSGSARAVDLESQPAAGLALRSYYQDTDEYFGNISAIDVQRGTLKYGADVEYELNETTRLEGSWTDEKDRLNSMSYRHATAGVRKRFGKTQVGLHIVREKADDAFVPANQSTTRTPFGISEETADDTVGARVSVETPLTSNLLLQLAHQDDLRSGDHNISHVGLDLRLTEDTNVYVREEFAKYEERSEARTVFGAETPIRRDTVAFTEYRLADGMDGSDAQQSIGLRNKFMLGDRVTGNLTMEDITTTRGAERQGEEDALALAGAIEYLASENLKLTSRLEYRGSTDDTSYLADLGMATKLSRDHSLLLKARHFRDDVAEQGIKTTSRLLLGHAYRPLHWDRFNALTRLEYRHNDDRGAEANSYIASLEGVYQVNPKLVFAAKYAGKLVGDDGFNTYTDLFSGRVRCDITDRFDIGFGYRVLHSYEINTLTHGGFAEIGCRIVKNLWLSLGYSLDRIDCDLTGTDYTGKGPYVRLRFKFDETTVGDLSRKRREQ